MARRQSPMPPAASGARGPRATGHSPGPRLMPGAQRFTRDAITLGTIPMLQPQQAVFAHVDDESDDSDETSLEPAQCIESSTDPITMPTQPAELGATEATATAPAAHHSTRLPFRLGRSRRGIQTDQDPSSSPKEQSDDSVGTLVEPASPPMESTNVPGPATPGCGRANEDATTEPSPTRRPVPSTTPAGLRGGASRPERNRIRSVGQEGLHAPSPLRQTQMPSPIHRSEDASSDTDEEDPVLHLQGYFDFESNPEVEYVYTFREILPDAPRTEPFRRTSQPRYHARSHSSGGPPPSRLFTPRSNTGNSSAGDDVFWNANLPPESHGRVADRPRLRSSEMSNTSLAYSYYELPENRHSSGEHSGEDPLSQSQYDGTASSRQASLGTYRSIRLSEAQAHDDNISRSQTRNTSRSAPPIRGFFSQRGASRLPAEPYTRAGNVPNRIQSLVRPATQDDVHAAHPDAMTAALENRLSPLDALTAQYGATSQRLAEQHRQPQRGFYQTGRQGPALYRSPYGPPTAMADDPYSRGATAHSGRSQAMPRTVHTQRVPSSHGSPHYSVPPNSPAPPNFLVPMNDPAMASYSVPPYPRTTQAARSGQRSSENAPVGFASQGSRPARTMPVQDQVSAFEQMHHAAQPR